MMEALVLRNKEGDSMALVRTHGPAPSVKQRLIPRSEEGIGSEKRVEQRRIFRDFNQNNLVG